MASINRVRVALTGFPGGSGVNTFYCLDPVAFLLSLRAYYVSLAVAIPSNTTMDIENVGDILNDVDGVLSGAWAAPNPDPILGGAGGTYAAPVGYSVAWLTATVADGKRLKGRTYHVPVNSAAFQTNGRLNDTNVTLFQTAADTLVASAAGNMLVWHRPRKARAATTTSPEVTQRAGSSANVTAAYVSAAAAVLRSRRD